MACDPRLKYSSGWAVTATVNEGIHHRKTFTAQRASQLYTQEPVRPLHVSPLTLLLCFQERKHTKTKIAPECYPAPRA